MSESSNKPGSVTWTLYEAQRAAGNSEAVARLMRRYYAMVISKANRRLRHTGVADASDVAIDVFDSVLRGLREGRYSCQDRRDFEELLGKVTYHKSISLYHWVKSPRRHSSEKRSNETILKSDPMKESHRHVAELYYLRGKTDLEIAAELQMSRETVQQTLAEIRRWLQGHRYRPTTCAGQEAIEKIADGECPLDVLILNELLESLDDAVSETVRLLLQGLSTRAIAAKLDVGERQVQRRLKLFKAMLRNELSDRDEAPFNKR